MSIIDRLLAKLRRRDPIIIETPHGNVPEWARRQAAINMRNNADLRARVEAVLIRDAKGDVEAGKAEFRRRYPEALDK